jgi:hypothetical protein
VCRTWCWTSAARVSICACSTTLLAHHGLVELATSSWSKIPWAASGNPTIADAVLDRLVRGAHRLGLKGESMRKLRAAKTKLDEAAEH